MLHVTHAHVIQASYPRHESRTEHQTTEINLQGVPCLMSSSVASYVARKYDATAASFNLQVRSFRMKSFSPSLSIPV